MAKEKHNCSKVLFPDSSYPNCLSNATILEDNTWWCKTHAPSRVKSRQEAREKAFDVKWREINLACDREKKAQALQELKAKLFDEMVGEFKTYKNNETIQEVLKMYERKIKEFEEAK